MNNTSEITNFTITANNDDLKQKLEESRQAILNFSDTATSQEINLRNALVEIKHQTDQAVINEMESGFEKQYAQIELNYKKKLSAINRWEQEQIKLVVDAQKAIFTANGGNAKDFVFNPAQSVGQNNPDSPTASDTVTQIATSAQTQRSQAGKSKEADGIKVIETLRSQWTKWANDYQIIEDKITEIKKVSNKSREEVEKRVRAGELSPENAEGERSEITKKELAALAPYEKQKKGLRVQWAEITNDITVIGRMGARLLIDEINKTLDNTDIDPKLANKLGRQLNRAENSLNSDKYKVKKAKGNVETARVVLKEVQVNGGSKEDIDAAQATKNKADEDLAKTKKERNESAAKDISDISAMANATSALLKTFGVESPAVNGVVNTLGALATIDFSNPMSIVTGSLNAISSLMNGIFGESDLKKEKEIKRMQKEVDVLHKSYDVLGKSIGEAYSEEKADFIEQQTDNLEKQNALIKEQKEQESSKKTQNNDTIANYDATIAANDQAIAENKIKAQDAIFGDDMKSAIDDFASAYMDAWASGEDRAQSQKDVVKKMIRGIITEMVKSNISASIKDIRDKIEAAIADGEISPEEEAGIDAAVQTATDKNEAYTKPLEKFLTEQTPIEEGALEGQIRGTIATEQSVAELGGIMRRDSENIFNISTTLETGFAHITEMAKCQIEIAANTLRTANNTDGLVARIDDSNKKLDQVISNTQKDHGQYN